MISDDTLIRFQELANTLADHHRALAQCYIANAANREAVYASGTWSSFKEAERAMDLASFQRGFSIDISRLTGEIAACNILWSTIKTLIEAEHDRR